MIKETATVIAVDGDVITVEAAIKTTCSSCQAQSDCGSGVISRALSPKTQQLTLQSPVPCKVGDKVSIGVPEAGIVTASLWLYVIPLIIFIASALSFNALLPAVGLSGEFWVLLGSLCVTFLAFTVISGYLKKRDQTRFRPVILSSIPANGAVQQHQP